MVDIPNKNTAIAPIMEMISVNPKVQPSSSPGQTGVDIRFVPNFPQDKVYSKFSLA